MSAPRLKVVVTHWVHPGVVSVLEEFATVVVPARGAVFSRDEVLQHARDADAVVACMADCVDDSFLEKCPRLRIVAATLKGFDNFDAAACERHGVWLTIVPEEIIAPTAELAIGLALTLLRRIGEASAAMRHAPYRGWRPTLYGQTLRGATVGILGMGALGQAIASQLRGFEPSILYHDRHALPPGLADRLAASWHSPQELMTRSQVVFVALPLTADTKHLVDAELIALMPPTSVLVNIGRGSVVDEEAVAAALDAGRIGGYAADVFAAEDWALPGRPADIPAALVGHPRAVLTPHLGSAVDGVREQMSLTSARQVRQALHHRRPDHAVNDPYPEGNPP